MLRILIVEDEPLVSMLVERLLTGAGYLICAKAASGEEAVARARDTAPDLLLLDVRLAGEMDGIDAAARIRTFCETPIIFMTGYQDRTTRERAIALAPLAILSKPLKFTELQRYISTLES